MAVVLLISLLSVGVVLSLQPASESAKLRQGADQLAASLEMLSIQASTRRCPIVVQLTPGSGGMAGRWIGEDRRRSHRPDWHHDLPEGVFVERLSGISAEPGRGGKALFFHPSGHAEPFAVVVRSGRSFATVRWDPASRTCTVLRSQDIRNGGRT